MAIPNIFTAEVKDSVITRINGLTPESTAQWGKMNVAQMLAHCCVTYEMIYEPTKHKKPNAFMRFILKAFVKKVVVGEGTYKKSSQTAPAFLITNEREFDFEKNRLINFIEQSFQLGEKHFDGKESHSFGILNKTEWNNMFYKHLDHHLTQFGA